MNISLRRPSITRFPTVRTGMGETEDGGPYHEFFSGMQYLLAGKWDEKNPHVGELSAFPPDRCGMDGRPVKQLQTIEIDDRERLQSAIHHKEMTKWQTHP
jgi:hypothetical protein